MYCIRGHETGEVLSITNANIVGIVLRDHEKSTIVSGLDEVLLEDSYIANPPGAYLDGAAFYNEDDSLAESITIKKLEKYDLYVGGVQVTSENCGKITGDISYDPDNKILHLDSSLTADSPPIKLNSGISALTIDVGKDVTLSGAGSNSNTPVIKLRDITTITGGTLTVSNTNKGIAIYADGNSPIYFENAALKVTGGHGIASLQSGAGLIINNSYIDVKTSGLTNSGAVIGFNDGINLNGCQISTPWAAKITDSGIITDKQGNTAKEVLIDYGLIVGDVPVTFENKGDILGDGVFEYVPSEKTLYVDGRFEGTGENYADYGGIVGSGAISLDIINSDVDVNGGGDEAVATFTDIQLTKSGIKEPSGAYIGKYKGGKAVLDKSGAPVKSVIIRGLRDTDVDNDGDFDADDVKLMLRYVSGLSVSSSYNFIDYNRDKNVDLLDAIAIL